MIDAQEGL